MRQGGRDSGQRGRKTRSEYFDEDVFDVERLSNCRTVMSRGRWGSSGADKYLGNQEKQDRG